MGGFVSVEVSLRYISRCTRRLLFNQTSVSYDTSTHQSNKQKYTAGIGPVRKRGIAREFFPAPSVLDCVRERGFRKTYFPKFGRACARPSVRPEARRSRIGRFLLTKNEGF